MKRALVTLLAVLMLCSCLGFSSASAEEGNVTFEVSSGSVHPGETVDIYISITNSPGLQSFKIVYDFDENALEQVDAVQAGITDVGMFNVYPPTRTCAWVNMKPAVYNGPVLKITFKVKEGAELGDHPVTIKTEECEVYKDMKNKVTPAVVNGNVTFACEHLHTHIINKKDATCTEGGNSGDLYCDDCGHIIKEGTKSDPLGHEWGEWVVTTEPTCTEKGEKTRTCKRNPEHKETEEMEALGHDWGEWKETKKATCTEAGEKVRICKNDPTHVEKEVIPATGHDWGEWKVTTKPTCTEKGEKTRVCKNDSKHVEKEDIPALGHKWDYDNIKYVWGEKDGKKTCTATVKCLNEGCKETLKAEAKVIETKIEPTYLNPYEQTVYTASFKEDWAQNHLSEKDRTQKSERVHKDIANPGCEVVVHGPVIGETPLQDNPTVDAASGVKVVSWSWEKAKDDGKELKKFEPETKYIINVVLEAQAADEKHPGVSGMFAGDAKFTCGKQIGKKSDDRPNEQVTVSFEFKTGKPTDNPKTGDAQDSARLALISVLALCGVATTVVYTTKKKHNR